MVSAPKHEYLGAVELRRKKLLNMLGDFREVLGQAKPELSVGKHIYQMDREGRQ